MSSLPQSKTCTKCGQEKPLNEFHKSSYASDGHKYRCKICRTVPDEKRLKARPQPKVGCICDRCGKRFMAHFSDIKRGGRKYCGSKCYHLAQRTIELDRNYFSDINSPDKAYWLGFLAADGNINDGRMIRIKLSRKDRGHLQKFLDTLGCNAGIKDGRNNIGAEYSVIAIHSPDLANQLFALGFSANKIKTIKPWNGKEELMRHYWRGVLDGDGWYNLSTSDAGVLSYGVGFCGNKYMVAGFRDYMTQIISKRKKIILKESTGVYQVIYAAITDVHLIICHLYHDTDLYLERKKETAHRLLNLDIAPRDKITYEQACDIRRRYAMEDVTQLDLGKEYGVSNRTISKIVLYQRHTKPPAV